VQQATDAARTVQTFATAVENKDYGKVLGGVGALGAVVADKVFHLEADPDTVANAQQLARGAQQVAAIARAVDNKDYGGALVQAGAVAGGPAGIHLGTGTGTASLLETAGRAGQQVQSFVASVEKDDFAGAVRKGAELLGFERQDRLPGDAPKPAAPKDAAQTVALSDVWTRWEAAQTQAQAQR
jgi:limonene-1,2-epoxide hydrolase